MLSLHGIMGVPIDWDNLVIEETKSCENFFLIPLILGAYKKYIHDLQKVNVYKFSLHERGYIPMLKSINEEFNRAKQNAAR